MSNKKSNIHQRRLHIDRRADQVIASSTGGDDDLLSTREVADWFGVSVQWLEIGRTQNYGPPHMKLGPRSIRYKRDDVLEWLDQRANATRSAA